VLVWLLLLVGVAVLCWSREMASDGMKRGGAGRWGGICSLPYPNIQTTDKKKKQTNRRDKQKRENIK